MGRFVLARAPLRRCEWPMATLSLAAPVGPTLLFLTLFWEVTEIASETEVAFLPSGLAARSVFLLGIEDCWLHRLRSQWNWIPCTPMPWVGIEYHVYIKIAICVIFAKMLFPSIVSLEIN